MYEKDKYDGGIDRAKEYVYLVQFGLANEIFSQYDLATNIWL